VGGTRHLVDSIDRLRGLLRVPRELRDSDVVTDLHRTGSRVLERLERDVDAVIHGDRARPRQAAVGRLNELDVELGPVPVFPDEVDVSRMLRARDEMLEDPVAEGRVR